MEPGPRQLTPKLSIVSDTPRSLPGAAHESSYCSPGIDGKVLGDGVGNILAAFSIEVASIDFSDRGPCRMGDRKGRIRAPDIDGEAGGGVSRHVACVATDKDVLSIGASVDGED